MLITVHNPLFDQYLQQLPQTILGIICWILSPFMGWYYYNYIWSDKNGPDSILPTIKILNYQREMVKLNLIIPILIIIPATHRLVQLRD